MGDKIKITLKHEYRANVIAQTVCLIINSLLYAYTKNLFFLWTNMACITFIGIIKSQPKDKFYDTNLLNHCIFVFTYYLVFGLAQHHHLTYLCQIFVFTYIFFILKDQGFTQSISLWTYIQALMIATSFITFPFYLKISATLFAFIETQAILFLCFKLFPSHIDYVKEQFILNIKNLKKLTWFNYKHLNVQLAIRASITAALLYIVCITVLANDQKPNWAVIAAIGSLMRDDDEGSKRSMISCAVASILGYLISELVIYYFGLNRDIAIIISWLFLMVGMVFIFEFTISKTYTTQILSITCFIVALASLFIALDLNSKFYLHLKIMNNLIGIVGTLISLEIWIKLKAYRKSHPPA